MGITADAPAGGVVEQLDGESRVLVLRNGEIERFEARYAPLGMFEVLAQTMDPARPPQVRHCRDIVALALVGGGMNDARADRIVASMPPSQNLFLRSLAGEVLAAAFVDLTVLAGDKKKGRSDGSQESPGVKKATVRGKK